MRTLIAGLACAAFTFAYRYLSFDQFSNDHFVHLARAQQMLMGEWPVRDFVETGFPLMSALSALAQATFGPGLHTELLFICLVYAVSAALLATVAIRLTGSITLGLVAAAPGVLAYPLGYSYPKYLPYAMVFIAFFAYVTRPSRGRLVLTAAAVACAFLLRHDHGVILGGAVGVALAAETVPVRLDRKSVV